LRWRNIWLGCGKIVLDLKAIAPCVTWRQAWLCRVFPEIFGGFVARKGALAAGFSLSA